MNISDYDLVIRIAGNTQIPCYCAIKAKGYEVTVYSYTDDEYMFWNAEKDNRLFSATNPIELLGLISMWEMRGDKWSLKDKNNPNEIKDYNELRDNAPVYQYQEIDDE